MTDNEIIKALERCANADCLNCPRWNEDWTSGQCNDFLQSGLDLINRQKAELDNLKRDDLPRCKDALRRANEIGMRLDKENQELKAEIEKLQAEKDEWKISAIKCADQRDEMERKYGNLIFSSMVGKVRAEAIKEFAERVKEELFYELGWIMREKINDLVKEMTERSDTECVLTEDTRDSKSNG